MNPSNDKSALLLRVAATRAVLAGDLEVLGHALDVPGRLRSSFRLHPLAWVGGAVAVGAAAASMFRRGGKGGGVSRWRAVVLGLLGFLGNRALSLSLPALRDMAETELSRWLERRPPASDDAAAQEGQIPG